MLCAGQQHIDEEGRLGGQAAYAALAVPSCICVIIVQVIEVGLEIPSNDAPQ